MDILLTYAHTQIQERTTKRTVELTPPGKEILLGSLRKFRFINVSINDSVVYDSKSVRSDSDQPWKGS